VRFDYRSSLCSQLQEKENEPPGLERMSCGNLWDELLPYLPNLMDRLFTALNPNNLVHLEELARGCIGATSSAAKDGIVPYLPRIIEMLNVCLTEVQSDETLCLHIQAVDTLSVRARSVGPEHFLPLAQGTVQLGLNLLSKTDGPALRKSCYGLFAALSTVLKDDMGRLPTVVEMMLYSIESMARISPHFKEA
jgi:hypothetical protein